jgi:cytochrome P450 monooxygenase
VKDGQRWKIMRKYFDPEFSFQTSRRALPSLHKGVMEWCASLPIDSISATGPGGGFLYNVKESCRFLPFKIIAAQLYGEVFDEKVSPVVDFARRFV